MRLNIMIRLRTNVVVEYVFIPTRQSFTPCATNILVNDSNHFTIKRCFFNIIDTIHVKIPSW